VDSKPSVLPAIFSGRRWVGNSYASSNNVFRVFTTLAFSVEAMKRGLDIVVKSATKSVETKLLVKFKRKKGRNPKPRTELLI
jgi:hypothetical protein